MVEKRIVHQCAKHEFRLGFLDARVTPLRTEKSEYWEILVGLRNKVEVLCSEVDELKRK